WTRSLRLAEWAQNTVGHDGVPQLKTSHLRSLFIPFWADSPWMRCPVYGLDDSSYMNPIGPGSDIILPDGLAFDHVPPAEYIPGPEPDTPPTMDDRPLAADAIDPRTLWTAAPIPTDELDVPSLGTAAPDPPAAPDVPPPSSVAPAPAPAASRAPGPADGPVVYDGVASSSRPSPADAAALALTEHADHRPAATADAVALPMRTWADGAAEREAALRAHRAVRRGEKLERKARLNASLSAAELASRRTWNTHKARGDERTHLWRQEIGKLRAAIVASPEFRDSLYPGWQKYIDPLDLEDEPRFDPPHGWGHFGKPPKGHQEWAHDATEEWKEGIVLLQREFLTAAAAQQGHPEDLREEPDDWEDDDF
ncbi:hypothetical protein CALCODRAFT_486506, partial [Calocera cornea HHB12733]